MALTRTILAATAVIALSAGTASALGISVTGTKANPTGDNAFTTKFDDAAASDFLDGGLTDLVFSISGPIKLVFSLVGHESGFKNSLEYQDGSGAALNTISETSTIGSDPGVSVSDFKTGILSDGGVAQTFMQSFSGGEFGQFLKFTSNGFSGTIGTESHQFGVFLDGGDDYDAATVGSSFTTTVSHFFLALDDGGAGPNDNHDDIVVRVAAVPLPAAAWLLLGVSGGLIAAKRRSSARKAA